VNSGL